MSNQNQPAVLTPFSPRAAEVQAVQFLGELDPESSTPAALAVARTSNPARPADLTLTGTFLGLPVRFEPFRPASRMSSPSPVAATLHLAPETVPAVLVPTAAGGHAAFPSDWIVQAADGTFSVWSDEKFRASFDASSAESEDALEVADGSGTGRYGSGDHWTQRGDGTDYPSGGGSFGVPQNGPVEPLKPFAPFQEAAGEPTAEAAAATGGAGAVGPAPTPAAAPSPSDPIVVGSSFRILRADQSVDPDVHVVKAIELGLVTYESDGETLEVSRDHVVPVTGAHEDILA